MSRNSGGTYTLPGVPFINGTTADANTVNAKFADLGVEMSDSLSRSGKGSMGAPLKLPEASDPAPALTFTSDESVGIRYDTATTEIRLLASADVIQAWSLTQATLNVPLSISGALSVTGTVRAGNGASNAPALSFGSDTDTGFYRAGSADVRLQIDATQVQKWTATGTTINQPLSVGGALGCGAITAIAATGAGVDATGAAGSPGAILEAGTAASATVPQNAIVAESGYLKFQGAGAGAAVNPNSDVGFTNSLTPLNIPKAWAAFQTVGSNSTSATVSVGYNVTSVTVSGTTITVNLAADLAGAGIAIVTPGLSSNDLICETVTSAGTVTIEARQLEIAGTPFDLYNFQTSGARNLQILVFGAQT